MQDRYQMGKLFMSEQSVYFICQNLKEKFSAFSKARNDIELLCLRRNYIPVLFGRYPRSKPKVVRLLWYLFRFIPKWIGCCFKLKRGSILVLQYPFRGNITNTFFLKILKKLKKIKLVILIHDLETLRGGIAGIVETHKSMAEYGDKHLLPLADGIICHNYKMNEYLCSQGIEPSRLVNLDLFDYIADFKPDENFFPAENVLSIAGNLAPAKSEYIYKLINSTDKIHFNLYGKNIAGENVKLPNTSYKGVFSPEELVNHLEGKYGLVWDGTDIYSCVGSTGEYLKYNCPHKTSLYLACGIPVVVWSQAAIAEFIKEKNVGIVTDSLENIHEVISQVSDEQYNVMKKNAVSISQELTSGHFFYTALDKCIAKINT